MGECSNTNIQRQNNIRIILTHNFKMYYEDNLIDFLQNDKDLKS